MECIHDRDQRSALKAKDDHQLMEEFAARTARAATCDRAAAERLHWEILDHLAEAAADIDQDDDAPVRRAIEQFGSPEAFACEYRASIFVSRLRNMRSTAILSLIVVFVGMRLRNVFLEPDWRVTLESRDWGELLLFVDRYAFLIALLLLAGGLLAKNHTMPLRRNLGLLINALPKGDFVTIAAPSILLLLSGLAIIASIFMMSGHAVINPAQYGVGALTFATLGLVCILISTKLASLAGAYAWIIRSITPNSSA